MPRKITPSFYEVVVNHVGPHPKGTILTPDQVSTFNYPGDRLREFGLAPLDANKRTITGDVVPLGSVDAEDSEVQSFGAVSPELEGRVAAIENQLSNPATGGNGRGGGATKKDVGDLATRVDAIEKKLAEFDFGKLTQELAELSERVGEIEIQNVAGGVETPVNPAPAA